MGKSKTEHFDIKFSHNFNAGACIKTLGLEEQGRLVKTCADEILKLSDEYVPLNLGTLKGSGAVEDGTDVVWSAPYANYMWEGIVYEDPDLHCAGFPTENGWRSRKEIQKVPTDRSLEYQNGDLRGSHWVDRMLNDGGLEEIQKTLEKDVRS